MRGSNPFIIGLETEHLVGRKEEIERFTSYIEAGSRQSIAVIGSRGIGKSTLIKKFRHIAEKNRYRSTSIYVSRKQDANELLRKINNADVDVIFVEDADKNKKLVKLLEKTTKFIILSSISEKCILKEKYAMMRIRPLSETEIKEFIEEKLKGKDVKASGGFLEMIKEETEGHPFVLMMVLWNIFDKLKDNEKVITRGNYLANLQSSLEIVGHNFFDEMYNDLSETEKSVLGAIVRSGNGEPKEISGICKKPLNTVTTILLRLVESGNVVKISRGKYRIFNKLYGRYVEKQ